MLMKPRQKPVVFIVLAITALSLTSNAAFAQSTSGAQPDPNVVILRSEKRVSISEPAMTLAELAKTLESQTGYKFTVSEELANKGQTLGLLMKDVPLSRVLSSTAYAVRGVWDEQGRNYHLRTPSGAEVLRDLSRQEAAIESLVAALERAGLEDQSSNPDTAPVVRAGMAFLNHVRKDPLTEPPFPASSEITMTLFENSLRFTSTEATSDGGTSFSYRSSPLEPTFTFFRLEPGGGLVETGRQN